MLILRGWPLLLPRSDKSRVSCWELFFPFLSNPVPNKTANGDLSIDDAIERSKNERLQLFRSKFLDGVDGRDDDDRRLQLQQRVERVGPNRFFARNQLFRFFGSTAHFLSRPGSGAITNQPLCSYLSLSLFLILSHTHIHKHTQAHTSTHKHTQTHTNTHTHTHTHGHFNLTHTRPNTFKSCQTSKYQPTWARIIFLPLINLSIFLVMVYFNF